MQGHTRTPLAADLEHVLAHTQGLWDELRNSRIFITGGTGFFGTWLLESFAWANDRLQLGAEAVVLTRDAARFARKAPHLADHPAIRFHAGDITDFDFPTGAFSHVIHAATESSTTLLQDDPARMLATIIDGTRRALEFARHCRARKFLLTSSGAVYGRQPPSLSHIPEDYAGAPSLAHRSSAYGEGKRVAELLCTIWAERHGISAKIARCFAFVGPYLPLDAHFAAGNFISDVLAGREIVIKGDGTPCRSYLYAADLAIWLWTILCRGESTRPYNVGSAESLSIRDLAEALTRLVPGTRYRVMKEPTPGVPPERYVPAIDRAREELGLIPRISLPDALSRTLRFAERRT